MYFGLLNYYSWYNEMAENLDIRSLSNLMAEDTEFEDTRVLQWLLALLGLGTQAITMYACHMGR